MWVQTPIPYHRLSKAHDPIKMPIFLAQKSGKNKSPLKTKSIERAFFSEISKVASCRGLNQPERYPSVLEWGLSEARMRNIVL